MKKYISYIENNDFEHDIPFICFAFYGKTHKGFNPIEAYKLYWIWHNMILMNKEV